MEQRVPAGYRENAEREREGHQEGNLNEKTGTGELLFWIFPWLATIHYQNISSNYSPALPGLLLSGRFSPGKVLSDRLCFPLYFTNGFAQDTCFLGFAALEFFSDPGLNHFFDQWSSKFDSPQNILYS